MMTIPDANSHWISASALLKKGGMENTSGIHPPASEQRAGMTEDSKPPYAPFPTFKNFIDKLHTSDVPHRVDKSVMVNLSGAAQSQILVGLRFLHLIDANGHPTQRLHELVKSFGTPMWATSLGETVKEAYANVVNGLDLTKATPAQLGEAFRDRGKTDGSITEKATRFYLKALDDAGVKYSTHLTRNAGGRAPVRRRKVADPQEGKVQSQNGNGATEKNSTNSMSSGMISFPIHLPGRPEGRLIVPSDIEEAEVAMVEAQIAYLTLYAKLNANKNNKKKE